MTGEIRGSDVFWDVLRGDDLGLDGRDAALYFAAAGRAALNDLRGRPFPCPEDP